MKRIRQRLLSLVLAASIACSWSVPVSAVETHDHEHDLAQEHGEVCDVADVQVTKEAVAATCTKDGKTEEIKCLGCGEILQKQTKIKRSGHDYQWVTDDPHAHWQECQNCGAVKSEAAHKYTTKNCADASVCSTCGYEKAAEEHIWGKAKVTKKVTCVEAGEKTYTCTTKGCGAIDSVVLPVLPHTPKVLKAKTATCTKDGLTEGSRCSKCKTILVEQEVIPAFGHTETIAAEGYPATCTKDGKTDKIVCPTCKKTLQKAVKIKKLGHNFVETDYNEDSHWFICTREDCGTHSTHEPHDFGDVPCETPADCIVDGCGGHRDAGEHNWGKEKVTKKATCTAEGVRTVTCDDCGFVETQVIEKLPHTIKILKGKAATCTKDGLTQGERCSKCKEILVPQEVIEAFGHEESIVAEGYPATCTDDGKTDKIVCLTCKKTIQKAVKIKKLGHDFSGRAWDEMAHWDYCIHEGCGLTREIQSHDYGDVYCHEVGVTCTNEDCEYIRTEGEQHAWDMPIVTKQPSCSQTGERIIKCKSCGFEETEILEMLPHEEVVLAGKEATCTTDGLTEGKQCSVCEEILVAQEVIPALGHKEVVTEGYAPTCTEDGKTTQIICERCGEVKQEQEIIPALGHNYSKEYQHDDEGHWGICGRCGESEPKIPHDYDISDCTFEAYCDCGHVKPAGQHSWGEWYYRKEPTCRDGGSQRRECSVCGEWESRDVEALGHAFENGLYGFGELTHWPKCDRCGIKDASSESNHNYPEGAVCTEDMTCMTCGYTKPAGEHAFGPYEIFLPPTCTEPGIQRATCAVCGATHDDDVYALTHAWPKEPTSSIPATCTEAGSATYTCARDNCGKTKTTPIPALGHSWGSELGIIQDATCTEDGLKAAICTTCGDKNVLDPIVIPATGHTKDGGTVTKNATCTEAGMISYVCQTCSTAFTEEIEMLPHQFVDGYCEVCGRSQATEVSTLSEMQTLLNQGESVRLTCDIDFGSSSLSLHNGMAATIYLDGHTITASYSAISLGDYDLKIVGSGTVSANYQAVYFQNSNGSLTAENVQFVSSSRAAIEANQHGTEIALTNCTLTPGSGQRAIAASYGEKVSLTNCVISDYMEFSYFNCVELTGCTITADYWQLNDCAEFSIIGGTYSNISASGVYSARFDETEDNPLTVYGRSSLSGAGDVVISGGTFHDDFYDGTTGNLTVNGGTFYGQLSKTNDSPGTITISDGTLETFWFGGYNNAGSVVILGGTFGNAELADYEAELNINCKNLSVTGGTFLNKPSWKAEQMDISGASFQRSAELSATSSLVLGDGITIPTKDANNKSIDKLKVYTDGTVTVNGGSYGSGFIGAYLTEQTYTGKYLINGGTFGNPDTYIDEAYNVNAKTEIRGGTFHGWTAVTVSAPLLVDGTAEFVRGTQAFDAYSGEVTIQSYGSCTALYLTSSTYGTIIIDSAIPADDTINVRGGILILTENADVASNIGQFTTIYTTQQLWVKPGAKVSGNVTLQNVANCNKTDSGVEPNGIGIAGGEFTGKVSFSASKTKLEVSGGTFSNFVIGSNLTSSQFKVSGGTFNIDVSQFLADGYMCTQDEDGNWVVSRDTSTKARDVAFWFENDSLTFTVTPTNNPEGVTAYALELSDSQGVYDTITATCTPDDLVARISMTAAASYDTLKVTTMLGDVAGDVLELDVDVSCTVAEAPTVLTSASYQVDSTVSLQATLGGKTSNSYLQVELVQKDGDDYSEVIETNYAFAGSYPYFFPGEVATTALMSGEDCYLRACGWYYDVHAAKYRAAVTYYDYSDYLNVEVISG